VARPPGIIMQGGVALLLHHRRRWRRPAALHTQQVRAQPVVTIDSSSSPVPWHADG
jgi:hypothetical protein